MLKQIFKELLQIEIETPKNFTLYFKIVDSLSEEEKSTKFCFPLKESNAKKLKKLTKAKSFPVSNEKFLIYIGKNLINGNSTYKNEDEDEDEEESSIIPVNIKFKCKEVDATNAKNIEEIQPGLWEEYKKIQTVFSSLATASNSDVLKKWLNEVFTRETVKTKVSTKVSGFTYESIYSQIQRSQKTTPLLCKFEELAHKDSDSKKQLAKLFKTFVYNVVDFEAYRSNIISEINIAKCVGHRNLASFWAICDPEYQNTDSKYYNLQMTTSDFYVSKKITGIPPINEAAVAVGAALVQQNVEMSPIGTERNTQKIADDMRRFIEMKPIELAELYRKALISQLKVDIMTANLEDVAVEAKIGSYRFKAGNSGAIMLFNPITAKMIIENKDEIHESKLMFGKGVQMENLFFESLGLLNSIADSEVKEILPFFCLFGNPIDVAKSLKFGDEKRGHMRFDFECPFHDGYLANKSKKAYHCAMQDVSYYAVSVSNFFSIEDE